MLMRKMKRRVRKRLREKYDLRADNVIPFAYFPDQKVKRAPDQTVKPFSVFFVSTPPQFNKEIEEVESIIRSFRPKNIPSQLAS